MPDDYESNWDDLARRFGFEAEEADQPEENAEAVGESDGPSSDTAKDSITDFFGDDDPSEVGAASITENASEEAVASSEEAETEELGVEAEQVEPAAVLPPAQSDDHGDDHGDDHWGSLAETFGLEEESTSKASTKSEKSVTEKAAPQKDVKTQARERNESNGRDADETVSEPTSEIGTDGIETIEFDVQDLSDEEDDRPRRRRKKRRRRRAVIEELKEELEREKEAETVDAVEEENEPQAAKEPAPEPARPKSRRRRRRRERDDSDDVESREEREPAEKDEEDESESKVSKNQRRRKKRTRAEDSDRGEDENADRSEAKPDRKFPTWEEAISPVVDSNIERASKPKRKKRPRRKDS